MKKVLIIDTSILCVWLKVSGKDSCGPSNDKWDYNRVAEKIEKEFQAATTFVLPLATIIETGNHIAQASDHRKQTADRLADIMQKSADQKSPWAAFSDQSILWNDEKLKELANKWPSLAAQRLSLGDITITDVANHYAIMGCQVEILTGDQGLKAFEPSIPLQVPRRKEAK